MLFEYALGMQIKLKNGEYVDFIRAITPILVDLFELVLKVQCKHQPFFCQFKIASVFLGILFAHRISNRQCCPVIIG